jgi:hypothetical protein
MDKRRVITLTVTAVLFLLILTCVKSTYFRDDIKKVLLSEKAIDFGRKQVKRMLKDRPGMRIYRDDRGKQKMITDKDSIWQWTMMKFAGEDLSEPVFWNSSPQDKPEKIDACHVYTDENGSGYIWIGDTYLVGPQKGEKKSFEDLWSAAIFELNNIANSPENKELVKEACMGNLSKEEFIKRGTEIEFKTVQRMKVFFHNVWSPWARKNNFMTASDSEFIAYLHVPDSYSKIIVGKDVIPEYFEFWNDQYDKQIVPYLKATGRYKGNNEVDFIPQ